jgi:hypothetical protein
MTELNKPISRRATLLTDNRTKGRECDQVVVTLYPNATIGFRAKRTRTEYRLPLETAYLMAIKAHEQAERQEKKKRRGTK